MPEYGASLQLSQPLLLNNEEALTRHLERIEKDLLYTAFKSNQNENKWVNMRTVVTSGPNLDFPEVFNFQVKVVAEPAENRNIYIPVYREIEMPHDVYHCEYCTGYTKNDQRGNCICCGAPRRR